MSFRNPRRAIPRNRIGKDSQFRLGHFEALEERRLLTTSGDSTSTTGSTNTPIELVDVEPYVPAQRSLFNYDGYLTGPSNQSPVAIAEAYLRTLRIWEFSRRT